MKGAVKGEKEEYAMKVRVRSDEMNLGYWQSKVDGCNQHGLKRQSIKY